MTVVNPKSISGINSITMASGSDNLLTIHTTNTTERVRVNSSGDVIVGSGITVSPDGDIFTTGVTTATTFVGALTGNVTGNISGGTVAGSTGTFSGAVSGTTGTFSDTISITDNIQHTGDTNTQIRFPANDTIALETAGSERLRITSDGKVSVNHTATSGMAPLSVKNTDDANINVFEVYNDNGNNSGGFSQASDGDGTVFAKKNDGTLSVMFRSDGNSYLTGGAFGVGTANPSDNIHLAESGATNNYIRFSNSNISNGWSVGAQSGGRFQIVQNGVADRFFIESDGNVTVNSGNLIMGTSGKGIDFSATGDGSGMTSELLDDYEEGTWTPALQFDVGGSGIVYGSRSGSYVKIGRMVHLQYYMVISSGVSSSDYFARLTLPYTGIGVQAQDARIRQWNTAHSDWFLSLGGSAPVFFMSNAMGSGSNYARGDDVNGHVLSGQYTLYIS